MKNSTLSSFTRIVGGGTAILLLGALAGWYFYLHSQSQQTATVAAGRDLGGATPSFGQPTGSTQANQALATQSFNTNTQGTNSSGSASSTLWEVDPAAVAGMGFVDTPTDEYVYYMERANGYVFSAHPSAHTVTRLTNTLTPKVYQVQFANDGSFVERAIDSGGNVTTFLGGLSASVSTSSTSSANSSSDSQTGSFQSVIGTFLTPNIKSIVLNPSTRAVFYLIADPLGGVDGISMQWNGTKKSNVFTSLIGSWNPKMLDNGTIVLLESPADGMLGYAYTLSSNGSLTPLVRNIPGLTILPKPSSSLLLYGASSLNHLSLFGVATGTPQSIPLTTIADKCVWLPGKSEIAYCAVPNGSPTGNFLDDWYKGILHTSDDWWEIDLSTGASQRVYSPSADNISVDVENPMIDASGNYITFINAIDQSLWVMRVAQ
jgi:hypothetical protein